MQGLLQKKYEVRKFAMRKRIYICLAAMICLFGFVFQANAAEIIPEVSLGLAVEDAKPGEIAEAIPQLYGGGLQEKDCEITVRSWNPATDLWEPGEQVTFSVTLKPKDGYSFSRKDTTFRVVGKNTELTSAKITASEAVVKIAYWPSMQLAAPKDLRWDDEESWTATWSKVPYCTSYEVKISVTDEDGNKTSRNLTVSKRRIDLSDYTADGSEVTCEVRAVPKTAQQKKYCLASEWVSMDQPVYADDENTTVGNFVNLSGAKLFVDLDGEEVSGWQLINGYWYYFDPENGNRMASGKWLPLSGSWYYFYEGGRMAHGWLLNEGFWYYLNDDAHSADYGKMLTGWFREGPGAEELFLNDGTISEIPCGACQQASGNETPNS